MALRTFLKASGVASAATFFHGLNTDNKPLRLWAKTIPALTMAATVSSARKDAYDDLVAAGLVASAFGDAFLEVGEETFPMGVGAFFVAHVLYTGAYQLDADVFAPGRAAIAYGVAGAVVAKIWSDLPDELRVGIAAYATAIATMLWRSSARISDDASPDRKAGAVGAAMFVASDAMIGFTRFSGGATLPQRYAIMILYWLGQLGIAKSALDREV